VGEKQTRKTKQNKQSEIYTWQSKHQRERLSEDDTRKMKQNVRTTL